MNSSWEQRLIEAINEDNEEPGHTCDSSSTRRQLHEAPSRYDYHARLALEDFRRKMSEPLENLRSDTVSGHFRVFTTPAGGPAVQNLLVGRMTVPGGPWPGHYGLEGIIFTAREAVFPAWFPPLGSPPNITFGTSSFDSNGFRRGQGTVLFPELLALQEPLRQQTFGIVFIEKMADLYRNRVLPILEAAGLPIEQDRNIPRLRELAFLAHEWGHLSGSTAYDSTVEARRRRMVAVIGELSADLTGYAMLKAHGSAEADAAAEVLLLDRLGREAWLPRAHSQVDSIAARQLLAILRDSGFATARGELRLDWDGVTDRLISELHVVHAIDRACLEGDLKSAHRYLAGYGWRIGHDGYRIDLSEHWAVPLRAAARIGRAA